MKIQIAVSTEEGSQDWWERLTEREQKSYLDSHPHSKYGNYKGKDPVRDPAPVPASKVPTVSVPAVAPKAKAPAHVVRDLTDDEVANETGEYFENDYTKEQFPNAFKNKKELADKIRNAKVVEVSDSDLKSMDNTDAGDILKSKDKRKAARAAAVEAEKTPQLESLMKAMKQGKPLPPSLVLRSKSKGLYLLGGNTRLMAAAAIGVKPKVKFIDIE